MKVRKGFVSNSSSSSFVVLLPEENLNINNLRNNTNLLLLYEKLLEEGELWQADWDNFDELAETLKKYIIATIDVGSEDGCITLVDTDKVRRILHEN